MEIDAQSIIEFFTTIMAVVIGGMITWLAQRQVFLREDERRKQDSAENDLATAQTILFKLQSILNSFGFVKKDLERARSCLTSGDELWMRFPPTAHGVPTVDLDYRELHLLMKYKYLNIVQDYTEAVEWVKNLDQSLAIYRSLHLELSKFTPDTMVGNVAQIALTTKNRHILPLVANLETLVASLETTVNSQYSDIEQLLLSYADVMHGMVGQRPTFTIGGVDR